MRRMALLAVMCCSPVVCSAASIDRAVVEELKEKGVPAWRRIESAYACYEVRWKEDYRQTKPTEAATTRSEWIAACPSRRLTLWRVENPQRRPGGMRHHVANADYMFEVDTPDTTKRGTLEGLQLLKEVDRTASDYAVMFSDGLPSWRNKNKAVLAATRVTGVFLEDLLLKPDGEFRLERAERAMHEGRNAIVATSRYPGKRKIARRENATYEVWLDPEKDYRIDKFVITSPLTGVETCGREYHPESDSFPHAPAVERYLQVSPTEGYEVQRELQKPTPFQLAEKEFYLPHYGFSEQVLTTLRPNPWSRWGLILAGIASLVVGGWLLWRRSRRQA